MWWTVQAQNFVSLLSGQYLFVGLTLQWSSLIIQSTRVPLNRFSFLSLILFTLILILSFFLTHYAKDFNGNVKAYKTALEKVKGSLTLIFLMYILYYHTNTIRQWDCTLSLLKQIGTDNTYLLFSFCFIERTGQCKLETLDVFPLVNIYLWISRSHKAV